jgi:catechol 2,3-dioxygenase-like lactoylglutathione lyase family enzyme
MIVEVSLYNGPQPFFALSVADLESSARWYSEKFGLRVVMQAPKMKTVRSALIVLAGGGLLVELIQTDAAMP